MEVAVHGRLFPWKTFSIEKPFHGKMSMEEKKHVKASCSWKISHGKKSMEEVKLKDWKRSKDRPGAEFHVVCIAIAECTITKMKWKTNRADRLY